MRVEDAPAVMIVGDQEFNTQVSFSVPTPVDVLVDVVKRQMWYQQHGMSPDRATLVCRCKVTGDTNLQGDETYEMISKIWEDDDGEMKCCCHIIRLTKLRRIKRAMQQVWKEIIK